MVALAACWGSRENEEPQHGCKFSKEARVQLLMGIVREHNTDGRTAPTVLSPSSSFRLSPFELAQLALISRVLYGVGDAEDADYDHRWDELFWACMHEIERRHAKAPEECSYALAFVAENAHFDGGGSLRMKEILDRVASPE